MNNLLQNLNPIAQAHQSIGHASLNHPMMMESSFLGGGIGIGGIFLNLLIWVIVIGGIIYLFKVFANNSDSQKNQNQCLEILKERYAKGEINEEEFRKIKENLS